MSQKRTGNRFFIAVTLFLQLKKKKPASILRHPSPEQLIYLWRNLWSKYLFGTGGSACSKISVFLRVVLIIPNLLYHFRVVGQKWRLVSKPGISNGNQFCIKWYKIVTVFSPLQKRYQWYWRFHAGIISVVTHKIPVTENTTAGQYYYRHLDNIH